MNRIEPAIDKAMTYEALGMLMFISNVPESIDINIKVLQRRGTGRDRAYRIVDELIDKGYVVREPVYGAGHKFAGTVYRLVKDDK